MTPAFALAGVTPTPTLRWFVDGLARRLAAGGYVRLERPGASTRLVINIVDPTRPRPFRRRAQATFVATLAEIQRPPNDGLATGYPILVRSLANLVILLVKTDGGAIAQFVTPEQGCYALGVEARDERAFFDEAFRWVEPLASAHLIIDNVFEADLEPELWEGDELSAELREAGRRLSKLNLLAPVFPVAQILSPTDLRHIKRLFGIGGLSYGNLSVRKDGRRFWMSASGVDKGNLQTIGRDVLMVSGFDARAPAMMLSVPPRIEPRRVSVDAIEHWVIYREHPRIGAIVHVHAWMEGIRSTQVNYPCGTIELANAVADLLRAEPDPTRAVIGLKNHGITVTGRSMRDIFERIDARVLHPVSMP
jgi:ribulose-5-phosphate 4-epimerase/fuculose-1-phosphate aldolase